MIILDSCKKEMIATKHVHVTFFISIFLIDKIKSQLTSDFYVSIPNYLVP